MAQRYDVYVEDRAGSSPQAPTHFGYVYTTDRRVKDHEARLGYTTDEEHVHLFVSNWGVPTHGEQFAMIRALQVAYNRDVTSSDMRECPLMKVSPVPPRPDKEMRHG